MPYRWMCGSDTAGLGSLFCLIGQSIGLCQASEVVFWRNPLYWLIEDEMLTDMREETKMVLAGLALTGCQKELEGTCYR